MNFVCGKDDVHLVSMDTLPIDRHAKGWNQEWKCIKEIWRRYIAEIGEADIGMGMCSNRVSRHILKQCAWYCADNSE